MWKSTDFYHNFPLNDKTTILPNNPRFLDNLLMDEKYFITYPDPEDNNIQKINNEIFSNDNKSLENIKDLDELIELDLLKENPDINKKEDNYIKDKKSIEAIQLRVKHKIYLKRPFKEKKTLGRKRKLNEGLGEHNKFSDDNIVRKCKHAVLDSALKFINKKIKTIYSYEKEILPKEMKLLKLKQNQVVKSKANYNKTFLNKTLKEIFSEDISTKYSRHSPSHNKDIIEMLINEKDEIKKSIFTKLFNLTFLDCLNHFRGTIILDDLKEMNRLHNYIKERKIDKDDEEYCNIFNYFINNFENIIMSKKARQRKSKNNI